MASGADGLAGLSAASGGGGAVVHPARMPTAIKGIEHRFMIRFGWSEIVEGAVTPKLRK
jgi:hypothetical protein